MNPIDHPTESEDINDYPGMPVCKNCGDSFDNCDCGSWEADYPLNPIPQESGIEQLGGNDPAWPCLKKRLDEQNIQLENSRDYLAVLKAMHDFKAGAAHTGEGEAVEQDIIAFTQWKDDNYCRSARWEDQHKYFEREGSEGKTNDQQTYYTTADLYQLFKQSKAIKP